MRRVFCFILLALWPNIAFSYDVMVIDDKMGDRPSLFQAIDFPTSHFKWREDLVSTFSPQGKGSSFSAPEQVSSFGLKNMAENVRLRTEQTLNSLGAKREGENIIVTLSGDVLFDFDKTDIRADARPILAQLSTVLQAMDQASLTIIGHTDAKGSDAYNQNLSEKRAEAAKNWLVNSGTHLPISTRGEGKRMPIAANENKDGSDNPTGRQKNRRVEFVIHDE